MHATTKLSRRYKLLIAVALLGMPSACQAEGISGDLLLASGDHIDGQWQSSDSSETLMWQPSFAVGVYEIPWRRVSRVSFPAPKEQAEPAGEYRFELAGDDVLYGNLLAVEPAWLTIEAALSNAPKLTEIKLHRAAVRRIVRLQSGGKLLYQGPNDPVAWKTGGPDQWRIGQGALATTLANATAFQEIGLPERFRAEIDLGWVSRPDFTIEVAVSEKPPTETAAEKRDRRRRGIVRGEAEKSELSGGFSLQVTNGWLVAVREASKSADLVPLQEMPKTSGRFSCVMYYDQKQGGLTITTPTGQLLANFTVVESEAAVHGGIRLINRSGDLRLESLRVYEWDGSSPIAVPVDTACVMDQAGKVTRGDLVAYDAVAKRFHFAPPSGATQAAEETESEEIDTPQSVEAADKEEPSEGATATSSEEDDSVEEPDEGEPAEEEEPATVELDTTSVALVVLASEVAFEPRSTEASITLHNGSRLTGSPGGVSQQSLQFGPAVVDGVLNISIGSLRDVQTSGMAGAAAKVDPKAKLAVIETAESRSKGYLNGGETTDAASCLVWRPRESRNGLPLRHDVQGRIVLRSAPKKENPSEQQKRRPQRNRGIFGAVAGLFGANEQASQAKSTRRTELRNTNAVAYLRGGDKLPCQVKGVGESGVMIKSPYAAADLLANEHLKAVELRLHGVNGRMIDARRERLLTLPRAHRDNAPTHLLVSPQGDYLRCRLLRLDDKEATIEVRLEERKIERSHIARIIWLDPPEVEVAKAAPTAANKRVKVQAVHHDGVRLTLELNAIEAPPTKKFALRLAGTSEVLGACHINLDDIETLHLGEPANPPSAKETYQLWVMRSAKLPREEPDPSSGVPASGSPLVGEPAPKVDLPWGTEDHLAGNKRFEIEDYQGDVLVLDFWASWCGPCVRAMPAVKELTDEFAGQGVRLVAINLQETREEVAAALKRMDLKVAVALDRDGVAAQRYEVTGIPQTVVIGRDGIVTQVFVGGGAGLEDRLREALVKAASIDSGASK